MKLQLLQHCSVVLTASDIGVKHQQMNAEHMSMRDEVVQPVFEQILQHMEQPPEACGAEFVQTWATSPRHAQAYVLHSPVGASCLCRLQSAPHCIVGK